MLKHKLANPPMHTNKRNTLLTFPRNSQFPIRPWMTIPRLLKRLQIINHQTLRTPKRLEMPRPPHRRTARHAFPRSKLIPRRRRTGKRLLGTRRKRRRRKGSLEFILVGIQKVPFRNRPVAPLAYPRERMADRASVASAMRWGGKGTCSCIVCWGGWEDGDVLWEDA